MAYRTIDAQLVLQTLERLRLRIGERFPKAGLGNVCAELALLATDTQTRVTELAKPMIWIRGRWRGFGRRRGSCCLRYRHHRF